MYACAIIGRRLIQFDEKNDCDMRRGNDYNTWGTEALQREGGVTLNYVVERKTEAGRVVLHEPFLLQLFVPQTS